MPAPAASEAAISRALSAANAAVASGKCRQITGGALYVHDDEQVPPAEKSVTSKGSFVA